MNPIERMQAELASRFPALSVGIDPPAMATGNWHLDVRRDGDHVMLVEWRPKEGFGFSTPKPDDAWSGHDEVDPDYDRSLDRITHLLATRGETVPPLSVRLAELRQLLGLTQTELAERAGMVQANLSRFENRDDMKLSTLQKVVTAMGASLSITVKFPDGSGYELRL